MGSQSLSAQLIRWVVALIIAVVFVHHCPPLLNAMAQNATEGGCHQGDGSSMQHPNHGQHSHEHHHSHHLSHRQ